MTQLRGNVKWFDTEKGWGFIRLEDGEEVFVHHSDIQGEGFRSLKDGAEVELEVERADRGPRARKVIPTGTPGPTTDGGSPESKRGQRTAGRGRNSRSRGPKPGDRPGRGRRSDPAGGQASGTRARAGTESSTGLQTLDEQVRDRLSPRFRFDA